jgi:hypothetical protein
MTHKNHQNRGELILKNQTNSHLELNKISQK